jgi:hypothetical protein
LAILGKYLSSRIRPFSLSYLPELLGREYNVITTVEKYGCPFRQNLLTGFAERYKMTCRRQEKSGKVNLIGQAIPEILKPLRWFLCSSREIISFKIIKELAKTPVYYRTNEFTLAPPFKWPDNTS